MYGGSGISFDWEKLANATGQKPYFLSGGIDLTHTSMIKEINDHRLYAVDLNSKFELEPGLKDVEKLKAFFKEMK